MSGAFWRGLFRAGIAVAPATVAVVCATHALAHTSERGHVMLLPTGYYLAGGALAVALSFVVLAVVPPASLEKLFRWRLQLVDHRVRGKTLASAASFVLLVTLIAAGFLGSRDPLSNPLPLTVWTLFWVGLTLLHGLFGNLWSWINPWYGLYRLAVLAGWKRTPLHLPAGAGYWPAVLLFFGFAWFELIYPAPDDPWRLALVISLYWCGTFAAMLIFGYEEWVRRGEIFSVFFAMVSHLSMLDVGKRGPIACRIPAAQLATAPALSPSGTLFLLLALASVSFDGLMRAFLWIGANGINPLEFPGRSAVIGINTVGLLGMFAALASAFLLAIYLGDKLAGNERTFLSSAGALIWSIIPISLAYHFSHYLVAFLVNGQYALAALSDPFARGWNLFGTADRHIHAGVTAGHEAAWVIWNGQAAAIIGGHVLAIIAAHAIVFRLHGSRRKAVLSQIPLAVLMVCYTVFGLWLLSTPTAG